MPTVASDLNQVKKATWSELCYDLKRKIQFCPTMSSIEIGNGRYVSDHKLHCTDSHLVSNILGSEIPFGI